MAERTFIKFTLSEIDPAWQRREGELRAEDKREMRAAREESRRMTDGAANARLVPAGI